MLSFKSKSTALFSESPTGLGARKDHEDFSFLSRGDSIPIATPLVRDEWFNPVQSKEDYVPVQHRSPCPMACF